MKVTTSVTIYILVLVACVLSSIGVDAIPISSSTNQQSDQNILRGGSRGQTGTQEQKVLDISTQGEAESFVEVDEAGGKMEVKTDPESDGNGGYKCRNPTGTDTHKCYFSASEWTSMKADFLACSNQSDGDGYGNSNGYCLCTNRIKMCSGYSKVYKCVNDSDGKVQVPTTYWQAV